MKKSAIPAIGQMDRAQREILTAIKENLEVIEGRRGRIELLPPSPTVAEVAAKVNEILARLQD